MAETQTERSDAELVAAYREGDVHAFEELHRRYVGPIYRLVHRTLGDSLLAEDIAQETFIRSLRTLDRVDENFNFGGWIHTVAQNLCRDEIRRRSRHPRTEEPIEKELMYEVPSTGHRFDPVDEFEQRELRRTVWRVAQRLPEKYKLVLTLRELQGFSYRRIAKTMKISESAVETLVYRARLRFKEEFLAEQGGDELDHREVQRLLKPYLAGKLRKAQEEAVRSHLAGCVICSRKLPRTRPGRRKEGSEAALQSRESIADG
jgi:RNA polymerase sigma-70 factor (ECF subfamily)